ARAFFQLIVRSARMPTRLDCQSEVMTTVASGGLIGAESICNEASRLTSIATPPSSANRTLGECTMITFEATAWLVITGIPRADPPLILRPGNNGCPSGFNAAESAAALDSDINKTACAAERPAATSALIIAAISVRPLAGVVPALVIGVTPFVTDPGATFVAGARAGSVNSVSIRYAIALTRSVRITASADGVEFFASSSVITRMRGTFVGPGVVVPNCNAPTGFGAPSPTHCAAAPPVCVG